MRAIDLRAAVTKWSRIAAVKNVSSKQWPPVSPPLMAWTPVSRTKYRPSSSARVPTSANVKLGEVDASRRQIVSRHLSGPGGAYPAPAPSRVRTPQQSLKVFVSRYQPKPRAADPAPPRHWVDVVVDKDAPGRDLRR